MSANLAAKRTGRSVRKIRGAVSQERIAKSVAALGITHFTQVTLSRVESGARELTLSEALALAEVLGVPLSALSGGETPEEAHAREVWRELEEARTLLAAVQQRYEAAFQASVSAARSGPEFLEYLAQH